MQHTCMDSPLGPINILSAFGFQKIHFCFTVKIFYFKLFITSALALDASKIFSNLYTYFRLSCNSLL